MLISRSIYISGPVSCLPRLPEANLIGPVFVLMKYKTLTNLPTPMTTTE